MMGFVWLRRTGTNDGVWVFFENDVVGFGEFG